jgi:flagellar basal-body rod protein FlgB
MFAAVTAASSIDALEQVLGFTEARHEVLVNNLANLDTPGYRMRDLSMTRFQKSLQAALASRSAGAGSSLESPREDGSPFDAVAATRQHIVFHDGNNRSIERQVVELTKNGMLHRMAAEILASQYQLLHAAISERV